MSQSSTFQSWAGHQDNVSRRKRHGLERIVTQRTDREKGSACWSTHNPEDPLILAWHSENPNAAMLKSRDSGSFWLPWQERLTFQSGGMIPKCCGGSSWHWGPELKELVAARMKPINRVINIWFTLYIQTVLDAGEYSLLGILSLKNTLLNYWPQVNLTC